jgi:L-threonylcarbamoyladenylate synthase
MRITLEHAAARIREGGLVAFPTETVYGLAANALNASAVAKIFALKGRPASSPLIVHAASTDMARRLVTEWPARAEELAARYWPGPLTLVLPKSPEIPDIVTAGLPTVGVRVPAHPIARRLIEAAGVPIAAPSANSFMRLSPTTAQHVIDEFGEAVDVLDGGPSPVGIESTVVSLAGGQLVLLRPGMISLGDIERAATPVAESHPAPGMHPKHYSPRTRLLLVKTPEDLPDCRGAYVWWNNAALAERSLRMPSNPAAYAMRIYDVLHRLDREYWPWIAVEIPPDTAEWAAVLDRLQRASA